MKLTTLESEIFDRRKNDISFLLNDRLIVFLEHQSTVNFNMPLRFLLYCAKTYGIIVPKDTVYQKKEVLLPEPEFFVFYTGKDPFPEQKVLHLSRSFRSNRRPKLELEVTCFNINYPLGAAMLKRCKNLQGYSFLLHRIRSCRAEGLSLERSIELAIRDCKTEGLLTSFLKQHEGEMRTMLFRYLNDDEFREVYTRCGYAEGHEDGLAAGLTEGREEGIRASAAGMKAEGISAETICKITGLSREEVLAL
ncbi:MAG: hypothetical protein E7223_04700 [Clostridiales bacterium]|nr:hypothetical protein [Clostridiales bacterium]